MVTAARMKTATRSLAIPAPLRSAWVFQQIMEAQATFLQAARDMLTSGP